MTLRHFVCALRDTFTYCLDMFATSTTYPPPQEIDLSLSHLTKHTHIRMQGIAS